MNENNEDNEDSEKLLRLESLKREHHPIKLSKFTKKTQQDFIEIARKTKTFDLTELKNQASIHALHNMLFREFHDDLDTTNIILVEQLTKDLELIKAFCEEPVISISNPRNWDYYDFFADKSVLDLNIESAISVAYDDVYYYLYSYADFFLQVSNQFDQTGRAFLAELGVKMSRGNGDESYFEYSKEFLDGLFKPKHFRFNEKI